MSAGNCAFCEGDGNYKNTGYCPMCCGEGNLPPWDFGVRVRVFFRVWRRHRSGRDTILHNLGIRHALRHAWKNATMP